MSSALPACLFAPMEGMTDCVFRQVHAALFGGVANYTTPFQKLTESRSLTARERRDMDPAHNAGIPVIPQALTRDPDQFIAYLDDTSALGYPTAELNIGCPSPTVTHRGRGSGMLRDPDALRRFFDVVFAHRTEGISVKTRIGWESPDEWNALLDIFAAYPFERIVIHARTASEIYGGPVHPEAYAQAFSRLGSRAVYNGSLTTLQDVQRFHAAFPGASAVMIGRGLIRDPSLARQMLGGKRADCAEFEAWWNALYSRWAALFGSGIAMGRIKKMLVYPCSGLPDEIRLHRLIRKASSEEAFLAALHTLAACWAADAD